MCRVARTLVTLSLLQTRTLLQATPLPSVRVYLTVYPSTEWDMQQPFDCACGANGDLKCLGKIQGAKYLSTEQLAPYFVNKHIKELKSKT